MSEQDLCSIVNETPRAIPEDFLRRAVALAMEQEGIQGGMTVLIVDETRMRAFNKEFRGIDEATDVLSFPEAESPQDGFSQQTSLNTVYLGEIAVCPALLRI
ncbi:MAG: rRNA maturation RNase YbeY, partial [Candidatus Spechtbacterales bacterium]